MTQLKVLSVASEIFPLIKTGGLADVVGALPKALAAENVDMRTLIPGYPAVLGALEEAQELQTFPGLFGTARLIAGKAHGLNLFVLDAPYLYGRPGNPYVAPDGTDWPDNAYRYGALAKVAAEIGLGSLAAFVPDVVHMHDWQAGLTAAYMHYSGKAAPGTVMTVHNLAFQGQFPAELVMPLGLPPAAFAWDGIEHYGAIGFLKAGLQLADRITTVSPSYAAEIMQPEGGMGFDGLLRARADKVSGILNGIDTAVWDPTNDPLIMKTYDAAHLEARAVNKVLLRNALGLNQEPGALVVGVVSRLSWQKGLDLLLEVLPTLIGEGMQLALIGSGEAELEASFLAAAEAYPGKIGVTIGYDETLAHRIQAGADALLMPSRFEPCGLTQLCALRYGAVPVVSRVGGLSDTIIDASEMALAAGAATGVQFFPVTSDSLAVALWRTAKLFRDRPVWRAMQRNGMGTDVSWRRPAHRYASLYRELCGLEVETAGEECGKDEVASAEATVSGGGKREVAGAEAAGADGGKHEVASDVTAGSDGGKREVASVEVAGADGEKHEVASVEVAGAGSEKHEVASAGTAGSDGGTREVVRVEAAVSGGGKHEVGDVEAAGADSGTGAVSFVEAAGSISHKKKVPKIEADASEDDAGNVVSIACRDV